MEKAADGERSSDAPRALMMVFQEKRLGFSIWEKTREANTRSGNEKEDTAEWRTRLATKGLRKRPETMA